MKYFKETNNLLRLSSENHPKERYEKLDDLEDEIDF